MKNKNYIILDDKFSSKEIGLSLIGDLIIPTPNYDYEEVQILGADGSLFRKKGLKDMSLDLEFNFKIDKPISVISREIRKFFKGKKKLILSWNNEVYYKIKKIEISEISSELKKIGLFTVSFILDPYSYLISNFWLDITSLKEINNI